VLLALDTLARRYGRLPHEILELDLYEMGLTMMCYQEADRASAQLVQRLNRDGMPVFPAVILKS